MNKIAASILLSVMMLSCNVNQKKEAELPEVDVDVSTEEGQLPTYEVNWADVDVGTTTKTVEIPKVVIVMEEEEVEVPYIDVNMPDDKDNQEKVERNIVIEAEVTDKEHELEIQE
ncbi:MAG: hypothetical protein GYB35_14305, partial [Algicola sp.]|nr:hypothetical protein [Algicola sp.]